MDLVRAALEERGWGWWAVEIKGEAPFIGFVGLNPVPAGYPFAPAVETGWRLMRPWWGRGLAPEGARAALDLAFGALGMEEVVAFTATVNLPSRRVMEKLGMTRDPGDDFAHPLLAADHPLAPHVLYRIRPSRTPR
jgi:RimJ/RimL family protein N-acetyltransferase